MAIATWSPDGKIAPTTLKASAALTNATTKNVETAVEIGKGKFRIVTAVTAINVTGDNDQYLMVLEANTRDATSTYYEIGTLFFGGAKEMTGRSADDAIDEYEIIVDNPYDYQVRVVSYIVASSGSITSSVKAYALDRKE
jgi:hypothetical protein